MCSGQSYTTANGQGGNYWSLRWNVSIHLRCASNQNLIFLCRFLLAQLHLDSLRDKKTVKAVKSALARLPKGSEALEGAYGEVVERIDSQPPGDRELAHNVVSWLVNAKRPLTTTELQHALAIELGEHALDEDNLPDVEEMVSCCLGLVTVDEESNVVRMVHYTTQDYFESLPKDLIASAPANIASKCITYLSFDVFASGYCRNEAEVRSRLTKINFWRMPHGSG